jgi:WD40 repeat protein
MLFRKTLIVVVLSLFTLSFAPSKVHADDVKTVPVSGQLFDFKLSPNGRLAATYENPTIHDNKPLEKYVPVRLIELGTGKETVLATNDYARGVAFSPDSLKLATYSGDGFIHLWDTATGKQIKSIPAFPVAGQVEFLPDSRTLVVVLPSSFGFLLWDTDNGTITKIFSRRFESFDALQEATTQGIPRWLAFFSVSSHGKTVATISMWGDVSLWNTSTGVETVLTRETENKNALQFRNPKFSRDGKYLLYLGPDGIHVWDVVASKQLAPIAAAKPNTFALSPNGKTLAIGVRTEEKWTITLVAFPSGEKLSEIPVTVTGKTFPQATLVFTPDGRQLVFNGAFTDPDVKNALYIIPIPKTA